MRIQNPNECPYCYEWKPAGQLHCGRRECELMHNRRNRVRAQIRAGGGLMTNGEILRRSGFRNKEEVKRIIDKQQHNGGV
jgi:hypothetical protein